MRLALTPRSSPSSRSVHSRPFRPKREQMIVRSRSLRTASSRRSWNWLCAAALVCGHKVLYLADREDLDAFTPGSRSSTSRWRRRLRPASCASCRPSTSTPRRDLLLATDCLNGWHQPRDRDPDRRVSDQAAWRERLNSAVAGRICRTARVLDFDHVAPAVGLGSVEIREAVLASEAAGGKRAAVATLHLRVGGQGGDGATYEARGLGDRGEVRVLASRQVASVT